MTQSASSFDASAAAQTAGLESGEHALPALIRREFSQTRLTQVLELGGEQIDDRLWHVALGGPLLELLERPGKELRSRIVEVAYQVSRSESSPSMPAQLPLVVELLHTGSLIVDDIEDDSRYRRGRPALHLVVGLPLALNAGNWLYFAPHQLLEQLALPPQTELALRRSIDRNVLRCHYGQALDLGVQLGSLAQREVLDVVSLSTRLKTGSLLELSAEIGAIAAGAEPGLEHELKSFGRSYGVALQMLDDVSGLFDERRAHKGHEDLLHGRPTWPWAWLAEHQDEVSYSRLQHRAREVERRDLHPEALAKQLRKELGSAPYRDIHDKLSRALARLEPHVASRRLLDPLVEEIEHLERAYG
jgi:geranylgeranyl pyrophosphate synthase